ncbi:MerR family DNA-binding transcriptional regulator [Xenophilus arseniciresistens]|uniref:MerR family DNA-binding transcriptional regulator n=1 Tax=Xenophilus arseniciresistens TaxID=1283306 RepID=A0AAE3NBB8_9BURK|nr:MerR family DNA-binding transcriptional regulator [Xenophilus arseniciresistens]MDA7419215.1 MerR family DNA-binding transcriptional regulator [Xenophilus arseniciresistens]
MNISELAQRSGVSVHRLRRYEAAGLIQAGRSAGGYRRFDERVLREVTFIAMGRALDVPLPVLAQLLPRYRAGTLGLDELMAQLRARVAEVDAVIAAQRALRRRLVDHIAWCERRKARAQSKAPASPFPTRKARERQP